jgi:hypothetical protein
MDTPQDAQDAQDVVTHLKTLIARSAGGKVPRRVVIQEDGTMVAKTHPMQHECCLVSRCCDLLCGDEAAPREPGPLLDLCLAHDAPHAWEAARDDLQTGDLSAHDVTAHIPHVGLALSLLARTRCPAAFVVVGAGVYSKTTTEQSTGLRAALRNAMAQGRDDKDQALATVSRLAAFVPGSAACADLALGMIREHGADGVRGLEKAPWTSLVGYRPQVFGALLECATTTPLTRRAPVLAALASIVQDAPPHVIQGISFDDIVVSTLRGMADTRGRIDVRSAAAAAVLASTSMDPLVRALALTLRSLAAALMMSSSAPPGPDR